MADDDIVMLQDIKYGDILPLEFVELIVKVQQLPDVGATSGNSKNADVHVAKIKKLYDLEVYLNSDLTGSLSQILFGLEIPSTIKRRRFAWLKRAFRNRRRR